MLVFRRRIGASCWQRDRSALPGRLPRWRRFAALIAPLYAFIRRRGYNPEEAQDLTQEFFAELLERNDLTTVGPEKDVFAHFS